jgi:phage tail-like protein
MTFIADPLKSHQFQIIAPGLNPIAVQNVDIPDFEFDVVEHGEPGGLIKTRGLPKYGDVKIEKIRPMVGDNWIWNWIRSMQNGALAAVYKRQLDINQLAPDGITITDTWRIYGAWPSKVNGMSLDSTKSENSMETITLTIDRAVKTR